MKSIAIFVEGGGSTRRDGQDRLRLGFDALLDSQKQAARRKSLRWQLGLYGSRNEAFKAFRDATTKKHVDLAVLLVDSEAPIADNTPNGRVAHLIAQDGWTFENVDASRIHLMTQCMEAWIVADDEALAGFYGKDFKANALPKRRVLDEEPKGSLYSSLATATKDSKRGRYDKIAHASELLKRVRPGVVATRCISFQQFTQWLDAAITEA